MKQEPMMNKRNEKVESEVNKTMQLLDAMVPLEVGHQFRVRLMQRIDEEFGQTSNVRNFSIRFDFRVALMALLLMLNVASTLFIKPDEELKVNVAAQVAESQGDEYSTQEFAYYDQTASYETKSERQNP
jgi:hypothetical protein